METKITITNGHSKIVLTPENTFEKRIAEDLFNEKSSHLINTYPDADYKLMEYQDHKIIIEIKSIDKKDISKSNDKDTYNTSKEFCDKSLESVGALLSDDYKTGYREGVLHFLEHLKKDIE